MKKILLFLCMMLCIFSFVGCGETTNNGTSTTYESDDYTIDYEDAASFENALNDKQKVKGKVVQFKVNSYEPDSALGINCWSGEHLNFISEEELDVKAGDIIIGRITKEPSKILNSWKIKYEILEINSNSSNEDKEEKNTEEPTKTPETKKPIKETKEPTKKPTPKPTKTPEASNDKIEVHYIDVGQGDCTLIQNKTTGQNILIDAGDNNKGTLVQNYLQKKGVKTIDYLVLTHSDSDHIGGADVIITKFDIKNIIFNKDEKDSDTYRDVISAIKYKNYKTIKSEVGKSYSIGNAKITIVGPVTLTDDTNENSICILLKNGKHKFLFTGDAGKDQETSMISKTTLENITVYKAGHHGSKTSSSTKLLNQINMKYAVISCEEENSYGHPHAEVLNNLRERKVKVFRTDEQGTIVCKSDGKEIEWNCSPSESWKAGEPKKEEALEPTKKPTKEPTKVPITQEPEKKLSYIANKNTKKYHVPGCSSISTMSEKNKEYYYDTDSDELEAAGYVGCKKCVG